MRVHGAVTITNISESEYYKRMSLYEIFDNELLADGVFKYLPLPDVKTAALVCK